MALSDLTLGIFADDPWAALDADLVLLDHPSTRARVADWIVQRLRAAALLPERIQFNRFTPTALREAPLVLVYGLREAEPEKFAEAPLTYDRALTIALHVVLPERGIPDGQTFETIAAAFGYVFDQVLLLDIDSDGLFFGQQARDCQPGRVEYALETEGDEQFLAAISEYVVTYQQTPARPAETPLELVHADWDLGPEPDEQIEAVDEVEIEQDEVPL